MRTITAIAALALTMTAAHAEQSTPDSAEIDVHPTDAIRIEVDTSSAYICAETVIWAFNLPRGSLDYNPSCRVLPPETPFASIDQ